MREALRLARRGWGTTSPNPMVGAVVERRGDILGRGFHRRAGEPHAEIEAFRDAARRGKKIRGARLFVTLEPCSTHGRTPPCTIAILSEGIREVIVAATDPNPRHQGQGFGILRQNGIRVRHGLLAGEADELNEAFNHWIVHRRPFVIVKAAMTLDGKIATEQGESKWITGEESRAFAMKIRRGMDAILVGANTVLLDDPSLTVRPVMPRPARESRSGTEGQPRRIILDGKARTPLTAKILTDAHAARTTVVVGEDAPMRKVNTLAKKVHIWRAPQREGRLDLSHVLARLGEENVTSLLVEGGGETNASFLLGRFAQRVLFFYAPKVLGGRASRKGVAGEGARRWEDIVKLDKIKWRRLGGDLMMTARVAEKD